MKGFVERARSALTGLGITARRAMGKPETLRYPLERVTISPRWRGALRLTGILGKDDIDLIEAPSQQYNALVTELVGAGTLPPCAGNCPANVDARGQSYLIADGKPHDAYELVRARNTFPGVLGRICHHPCESACTRNQFDEPIAIRPLHRVACDAYDEVREERVAALPVTKDQRVAIIGSGPSGLTAAHDLMRMGYEVHVYEKEDAPGGALYTGVPSYRLPRDLLHREIGDLERMGMKLICNVEIGRDVPLDHLIGEYEAVLIAAGLQISRRLPLPGVDAQGVTGAIEFLKAGNFRGDAGVRGKRVLVVGGGNVAMDCARLALRVGAASVDFCSLESEAELPAHQWEVEEALDEGVTAYCSWGPHEVLTEDGHVVGMRLQSCTSVFDAQGRFAPQFADDFTDIAADTIVFSVGQAPDLASLIGGTDLLLTDRGLLPIHGSLLTTAVQNVFACGEVVTGPGSAIASIASGHEAATSIDRFLSGEDVGAGRVYRPVPTYPRYDSAYLENIESTRRRIPMAFADARERVKDFRQVEMGMTGLEGVMEASRCLRCNTGVCVGCTFCARTCPDMAIQVDRVDEPGDRRVTRYDFDLGKCCFCGLCAEQCPTGALQHTGQYELSFYSRDLAVFGKDEMGRPGTGSRATGRDALAEGGRR